MNKSINRKFLLILVLIFLLSLLYLSSISLIPPIKITILIGSSTDNKKYWVGEKYKITLKFPDNSHEKIYLRNTENKRTKLFKGYLLMNSSGRECLIASTKKVNSIKCFNIYNTPKLNFKEDNPMKIETNNTKLLNLDTKDYPKTYIKYQSNHPEIIKINDEGKITAVRPGSAIITASGLDNGLIAKLRVLSVSKKGLINNSILDFYNASQYKNIMIVAHPDDETLWGGANLFNDRYFVVCLTNGYTLSRANDFREILKFTNNSGIIMDYPDVQDNIINNWSEVEIGILKDLSTIINYNFWEKIVTHGPDGTTGHFHHKKTCEYVTKITKELNKYKNLYYFGKFYKKDSIPKYLKRISLDELEYKKKEVSIYKSVKKIIFKLWYHMLPYENWVLASEWKKV